jgi:manganese efflux pump family protein
MVGSLIILGFTLSLDNFRTAIALGGLRLSWRRSLEIALVFGLCDGLAPLLGIVVGRYVGETIGETGELVGAIGLGLYGLYLVVKAWLTDAPEEIDRPWAVYGLIVPLSADNILAGASLGLLGASTLLAPLVFGVSTFLMALLGLYLGRAAASLVRILLDLLTGVALVIMATVMGMHP